MLQKLMQQRGCDATDVIIKATEKLMDKYGSVIAKYNIYDRKIGKDKYDYKLFNFLCKHEPQYKALCDEYLSFQK